MQREDDLPLIARRAELAILTASRPLGAVRARLCCSPARPEWENPSADRDATRGGTPRRARLEGPRRRIRRSLSTVSGGIRPGVGSICSETELAAVRPILARVLPGWISDHDVLAPMADPAAVLAEALILLLRAMSADGAVLLIDDVHWADDDTVSVLSYLADSLDQLPLALIMTARSEPLLPEPLGRLSAAPSIRQLRLSRLQALRLETRSAPRSSLGSRRRQLLSSSPRLMGC